MPIASGVIIKTRQTFDMVQTISNIWLWLREHVSHWFMGGLISMAAGAAPEEWFAGIGKHLDLHTIFYNLWPAGLNFRLIPITGGALIVLADLARHVWGRHEPTAQQSPHAASAPTGTAPMPGNSSVNVTAGRDQVFITVEQVALPKLEELALICEHRAAKIIRELPSRYPEIDLSEYLNEFRSLHEKHVAALRAHRIIEAHEILREIYALSCRLDWEEIHRRIAADSRPGVDYAQSATAGERGALICGYMVGDVRRNSMNYPQPTHILRRYQFDRTFNRDEISEMYDEMRYPTIHFDYSVVDKN